MPRFRSWPLPIAIMASVGLALAIALIFHAVLPGWRWYRPLLHSAIEALGGLCAIVLALVLFKQESGRSDTKSLPLAIGFLAMGVLEECHAVSEPGNGFILLRGLASFAGAMGFVLAWLPRSLHPIPRTAWLPWATAGGALAVGLVVFLFPARVPEMTHNGAFTPAALMPTGLASLLFLASAGRFLWDYRASGTSEAYLFCCLALAFGLAELMFTYSLLWDVRWWGWHLVRLLGYMLVLGFMVNGYQRMLVDLRSALAQTREAEESARRSEHHLRQVLEDRERMAQDLHDGIIQSLFALTLSLERCQRLARSQAEEVIGQLGSAVGSLKNAIRDLRGFIGGLKSDIADGRELETALAVQMQVLQDVSDLNVTGRVDPHAAQLVTPDQAMHVLYIAREALSNALRHAQARSVSLVLERQQTGVRLVVTDDGIGFQSRTQHDGEGLKNMVARAARLHARLNVSSEPGHGTQVVFELPMETVHA
jgi:signal transduction histidine kinase